MFYTKEEFFLGFCQIKAAFGEFGVPVLACRPAYEHYGGAAPFGSGGYLFVGQGHFGMRVRPVSPEAVVGGLLFHPFGVESAYAFVEDQSRRGESLRGRNEIRGAHVAARSVADVEPVVLYPPEECYARAGREGKYAVVEEKHASVRGGFSRGFRHAGESVASDACIALVLYRAACDLIDKYGHAAHDLPTDVHRFPPFRHAS